MLGTRNIRNQEYEIPGTSAKVAYSVNAFPDNADQMERVLVEVKAPAIMDLLHTPTEAKLAQYMDLRSLKDIRGTGFGQVCHFIRYETADNPFERIISKVITDYLDYNVSP